MGPIERHKLGLIVNPIAGVGGRVGLKGSDGVEIVRRAFEMGAIPLAPSRAVEALRELKAVKDKIQLFCYPHEMGETEADEAGFTSHVVGDIDRGRTTASETRRAAREMAECQVDLILFAGGDGTARDIYEAIGGQVPVLGIPAGVKLHSSVFAINPRRAGQLVVAFLEGCAPVREMEVMDIDEEQFRDGRVSARLYGYLKVPFERQLLQMTKSANSAAADRPHAIAEFVVNEMVPDVYYILGPGTTIKAVGTELGIDKTLLGVDVVLNKKLVGRDSNEAQLLALVSHKPARIVVTVIGGQGYIFGRGNQQLSPRVIKAVGKDNVIVVATQDKLNSLKGPLLVDTGDAECDRMFNGYMRVVTGYRESAIWKVEN